MLETHNTGAAWLGLIGDTITVTAAIFLSLDAIHEAAQRKEVERMAKVIEAKEFQNIRTKVKGIIVRDHDGIEYAYIRRSSWRAFWGAVTLFIGFCFLLAARLAEILGR